MEKPESLARYHSGLIQDFQALNTNFAELSYIVRDIIIYLNKRKATNLFGYIEFELNEFANLMGYSVGYLRSSANYNVKKITYGDHLWDSKIETALLLMLKSNFIFSTNYKGLYSEIRSIQIINYLKVYYKNETNGVRKYEVCPGPYLFDSFYREFNIINFDDYIKIQQKLSNSKNKGVLTNLYLFLLRVKQVAIRNSNHYSLTVDDLSTALGIEITEDNHKIRKRRLSRLLDSLRTIQSLQYSYEYKRLAVKSRFEYNVVITFDAKPAAIDAEYTKFQCYIINALKLTYYKSSGFKEDLKSPSDDKFIVWLNDNNTDLILKQQSIKHATWHQFPIIEKLITDEVIGSYFPDQNNFFELYKHLQNLNDTAKAEHKKKWEAEESAKKRPNRH